MKGTLENLTLSMECQYANNRESLTDDMAKWMINTGAMGKK